MTRRLTPNCRDKQHELCLGGLPCHCTCHEVPAPPNLRELAGLDTKPEPEEDR